MGSTRCLLLLSLVATVAYSLDAPTSCLELMYSDAEFENLEFNQSNRTGNLERFCQAEADMVRREHFWCRGYVDENNEIVASTARAVFPTESGMFWTIFLQYPALSWMDVARKASIMRIIRDVTASQTACSTNINVYSDLCVSNVETYQVAEYTESVLITLYNLGSTGEVFDGCFRSGLRDVRNNDVIIGFRSKTALNLTLNVTLMEMFSQNIGPASSIGNPDRDPTLRPVYLGSWPGNLTLSQARGRTSDSRFATNPNPINYGLEAGDIVFAVFGSLLLLAVGILVVLGFFIHPFFLA